MSSWG
ncbi:hypothetical protein YPPY96_2852, partial [Yersinia pestis PY-96]